MWGTSRPLLILLLHHQTAIMPRTPRVNRTARKELTPDMRAQIVGAYRTGASMREVAACLNVSLNNVQYTVKQQTIRTNNVSLPRGRPRKSTDEFDALLVQQALAAPEKTIPQLQTACAPELGRTTIKQRLREHGITKRLQAQRPLPASHNRLARLEWVMDHRQWTAEQWKDVLWSDKSTAEHGGGNGRSWVFKTSSRLSNPDLFKSIHKSRDLRVLVWATCGGHQRSSVLLVPSELVSKREGEPSRVCLDMLKEQLPTLRFDDDCVLIQNDDGVHKAHIVLDWLNESGYKLMDWPPYAADLNPIEHVWLPLKGGVHLLCPDIESSSSGPIRISAIFGTAGETSWDSLKDELIQALVASIPDRVEAAIQAQGEHTNN